MTETGRNVGRGGGFGRSRAVLLALLGLLLACGDAQAQIDVLLRALDPAPPKLGACGRYRFQADESSGPRTVVFTARIDRIVPGPDGSVWLHITSGDSVDARVEVAPALFSGKAGAILDQVRSVVEVAGRDTTRLQPEDWATGWFDRAPPLPGARDSLLASRPLRIGDRTFQCHGRARHEANRQVKPLGEAELTQSIRRDVETWTNAEAPLLGLVKATATVTTERSLSKPVPGVPASGARVAKFSLELIGIGPEKGAQAHPSTGSAPGR